MSRGWLAHVPTGMPSLEYLALYDTLPAAANDPTAIKVRSQGTGRIWAAAQETNATGRCVLTTALGAARVRHGERGERLLK